MKVNGIIPGDLETDAKCTTPSTCHKTSVKTGNLQKLLNPLPKQVLPLKTTELEPKAKSLTSSPSSRSQAIGETWDSASVRSPHAAKLRFPTPHPSIKIGKDACLVPFRIGHSRSSQGVSRLEKDSQRSGILQTNGCSKSKERSSHPVTTPAGGSSMVSARACAKRKGEHVVDGGRDLKRPRFQDLRLSFTTKGREPALGHSQKPNNKARLQPQEVAAPARSPPRSWTPATATSPTAVGRTEQPHTSTSPRVGAASGTGDDGADASPLAGSHSRELPDSPANGSAGNSGFLDGPERGSDEDWDLSGPELDLGAFVDGDSSTDSTDSEGEPLPSLQEILDRSTRPPATPEKGAFAEPRTPVHKSPPLADRSRPVNYRNTLEQMLKEKEENQRSKDTELKLRMSCEENLLKLEEDSPSDGTAEEGISPEHRAILKRFSLVSNGIPDVHPGEEVFTLSNFGRFFTQQSLDLRSCAVTPQTTAQKILLQASPDELLFLISTGMLLKAYRSSPCQPAVTGWLFQMMSVHLDRKTSTQILRSMKDIALIAADQITVNKSRKFEVWTPSIQDVVLIFLNMGVPFATLFPLEALQPPFSEADILQSSNCSEDVSSEKQEPCSFPEHCFENVIKYLALCMALCPRAYGDGELLLLLTMVCRASLETRLQLLPMEDTCWLLHHLLNNSRDWDSQLPQICVALTDLTENHHNLRRLVQLLPDHKRGKQLRKHLSLSIISKLLNRRCTYKPVTTEFQLSALQQYLPRMRPSSLLSALFSVKTTEDQGEEGCSVSLDQQAYYLCYSLLALTNEATNFDTFPSNQKDQLDLLSAELEKYIKCDIREGEKWLYRSKVKDFVARIYTRWQILLHKSRPMQGKLHHFWQPLPEDTLSSSQESQQPQSESVTHTPEPQTGGTS